MYVSQGIGLGNDHWVTGHAHQLIFPLAKYGSSCGPAYSCKLGVVRILQVWPSGVLMVVH